MVNSETNNPEKIGAKKMQNYLHKIQLALDEPDVEKRNQILIDCLLDFGLGFNYTIQLLNSQENLQGGPFNILSKQSFELLISLLGGKKITSRLDEQERKAYLAFELLQAGGFVAWLLIIQKWL